MMVVIKSINAAVSSKFLPLTDHNQGEDLCRLQLDMHLFLSMHVCLYMFSVRVVWPGFMKGSRPPIGAIERLPGSSNGRQLVLGTLARLIDCLWLLCSASLIECDHLQRAELEVRQHYQFDWPFYSWQIQSQASWQVRRQAKTKFVFSLGSKHELDGNKSAQW